MHIIEHNLYHIYNQGNNKEVIFKETQDYLRFLIKTKILIAPHCDILAYCLMPNHFHFLIHANESSTSSMKLGSLTTNKLSNGFRLLLSEYAQEYNTKYNRSGSLFRQKTKSKCLTEENSDNYSFNCFHYIHQNPLKAKLVDKLEEWKFSSFNEYFLSSKGGLCNTSLSYEYIGLSPEGFYEESYSVISEDMVEKFYAK